MISVQISTGIVITPPCNVLAASMTASPAPIALNVPPAIPISLIDSSTVAVDVFRWQDTMMMGQVT